MLCVVVEVILVYYETIMVECYCEWLCIQCLAVLEFEVLMSFWAVHYLLLWQRKHTAGIVFRNVMLFSIHGPHCTQRHSLINAHQWRSIGVTDHNTLRNILLEASSKIWMTQFLEDVVCEYTCTVEGCVHVYTLPSSYQRTHWICELQVVMRMCVHWRM
jgi:hypothetical protein